MKRLFLLLFAFSASLTGYSQDKWEADIQKFEQADKQTPPPASPIVFVGSSSFTKWTDVQKAFPGKPIINRGFGGCELGDVVQYADRIITNYKPKQVVVYAGDNDLNAGKSVDTVYTRLVNLVTKIRRKVPTATIAFVSIKPSPSRWKIMPQMTEANARIKQYLKSQPNTQYVDVVPVMMDPATKRPKPSIFISDSLHMNASGYELWTKVLAPVLK